MHVPIVTQPFLFPFVSHVRYMFVGREGEGEGESITAAVFLFCNVEGSVIFDFGDWETHIYMFPRFDKVFEHGVVSSANVA